MSDLDELNALNEMAMRSIDEFGGSSSYASPPQKTKGDFWKQEDPAKRFRPSQQTSSAVSVPLYNSGNPYSSGIQRTFYRPTGEALNASDHFYRKILHAVYKSPTVIDEGNEKIQIREENRVIFNNLNEVVLVKPLFNLQAVAQQDDPSCKQPSPQKTKSMTRFVSERSRRSGPIVSVSPHTRNQLTAIVLSGVAKIITTAVLSWAKERSVPYDFL